MVICNTTPIKGLVIRTQASIEVGDKVQKQI